LTKLISQKKGIFKACLARLLLKHIYVDFRQARVSR